MRIAESFGLTTTAGPAEYGVMKRNSLATLRTALEHQNAGRLDDAEALYREVLRAEPANADALNLRGVVEHQRGNHQEAVRLVSKAVQVAPRNPDFHYNLGLMHAALRQRAEAVPCFRAAVRLRPDFHDAYFNLGAVWQALDQVEDATAVALNLAVLLERRFAFDEAEKLLRQVPAVEPGHAVALNNLGDVLLATRRPDEALRAYDQAITLKPDYVDAYYNRHSTCDFFSLQTGPRSADLNSLPADLRVQDVGSRLRDFVETAAVMAELDLIISADTATLHLAGALARPVWGLLPFAPDWRWMLEREDSPWYPTLRLFRQTFPGDWPAVLVRVQQELTAYENHHRPA
jgi:tetratricopeptide (TPR) repeat protein